MASFETVLALLLASAFIAVLARRIRVPVPIVMVLGGLAIALLPGLPKVQFPPELAFAIFVPPLLFRAAVTTSLRGLRQNARAILLLAIGLVAVTTAGVGFVTHHAVPELSWTAAFLLGAILSPPDAIVGIALARSLGASRRVVSLVEGETLLNDATAFIIYRQAVQAATTGTFSVALAVPRFFLVVAGGAAMGYGVYLLVHASRKLWRDPVLENVMWLLTPFAAFLPAEAIGVSGVLAVVVVGLLVRKVAPLEVSARTRIDFGATYDVVEFILNSLMFILIGIEMGIILRDPQGPHLGPLLRATVIVAGVVILIRILWIFPAAYLPRLLSSRIRKRESPPLLTGVAVLSWMGMRGGDSLVTALALPLYTQAGAPLPGRSLVVAIAFGVILATLLVQGLTLGPLIRWLRLPCDHSAANEEQLAREAMHAAAADRLAELAAMGQEPQDVVANARLQHEHRSRVHADFAAGDRDKLAAHRRIELELLGARRAAAVKLRNAQTIDDGVLRRLERELDHLEMGFMGMAADE